MSKTGKKHQHTEEFTALTKRLKEILHERKILYKELAHKMNMSESGVKKILSGSDCSFQKLMQISKILNVKFSDLLQEIEHEEMKAIEFHPHQQQAFLKDKSLFHFFVKLVIERMSVEEIKKEAKLTEHQTFKYLKTLDQIGMIDLLPNNKVKVPEITLVSNFGSGTLLEKTYLEWGHKTVDDLAHPKNQASGRFIIRSLKMKKDTYQDFLDQLKDLEEQIAKRALREMAVSTKNLILTRWVSLTDESSFIPGSINQQQLKITDSLA